MFASILFPENPEPEELDHFLADGWYRMGQSLFTTHFLCFQNQFYSAIWLRVGLADAVDDPAFIRLQKRNASFRIEIKKAVLTPQHEALYASYKQAIPFEPSETLQTLLYGFTTTNHFDTWEVNIYDNNLLIAAGFFDIGKHSAAGIVSFYHPDYKKHSLGKYLIYLKMGFCKKRRLAYFYPGYVAPGYPAFDYKTSIGKKTLEYFSVGSQQWLTYTSFSAGEDPLQQMCKQLNNLQEKLSEKKLTTQLYYYRFFDANLDPYYSGDKLFDFPVFLQYIPVKDIPVFKLIVFDIYTDHYCILQCSSVIQTDWFKTVEPIFSRHLLRVDQLISASAMPEEIVAALQTDKSFRGG